MTQNDSDHRFRQVTVIRYQYQEKSQDLLIGDNFFKSAISVNLTIPIITSIVPSNEPAIGKRLYTDCACIQ